MTSLLSDCRGPAWLLVIPLVLAVYPFSFKPEEAERCHGSCRIRPDKKRPNVTPHVRPQ